MESFNKWFLHSSMIIASMVIAYYGIQSMHSSENTAKSLHTQVVTEGQVVEAASQENDRKIALNKKLKLNYQNEIKDLQKLGLSSDSKPVRFAQQKVEEAQLIIDRLEKEVSK